MNFPEVLQVRLLGVPRAASAIPTSLWHSSFSHKPPYYPALALGLQWRNLITTGFGAHFLFWSWRSKLSRGLVRGDDKWVKVNSWECECVSINKERSKE
ncbi:uncharacterized protein LOC144314089 [Canis aureus]